MISDFTDHTSVYMTADNGIDQSQLLNNQMYNSMEEMYNKGRMFRLPTNEIQEQIRFKLEETALDLYLYTGTKEEIPVISKKCPFQP